MKKNNTIVLTGGGSTGHVSVNLALIPLLKENGWDIHYIGSKTGIEKELVENIDGVKYHSISTGKLRRYFSFENFLDIFRIIGGVFQSIYKIFKIKPNIVFSKGGFVSVPVILGGWMNRIPVISHESDLTPGLANRLVQPFVKLIFTTFPETSSYIKSGKGVFLGPVIRDGLKNGNAAGGKKWLGIKNDKATLLVMGGSLGAEYLNNLVRDNLDDLLPKYNIIHACGKDSVDNNILREGYYQFEYINEELKDIMEYADIAISRSGANAIFEFLYHKIPMLLIPLPSSRSRGDQIDNAKSFVKNGFAEMIEEENLNNNNFLKIIDKLDEEKENYQNNMKRYKLGDTLSVIYNKIDEIKK